MKCQVTETRGRDEMPTADVNHVKAHVPEIIAGLNPGSNW
jgi:hypothetical protein